MASFRPFNFIKDSYIADIVSATTIYHGFYNCDIPSMQQTGGSVDTSKAQFLIAKEIRDGSGDTTSMKYCGNGYNNIWDDRATLVYL